MKNKKENYKPKKVFNKEETKTEDLVKRYKENMGILGKISKMKRG